jgi:hypothetical protein
MSAASVTNATARAVVKGSKHWPHTSPALTVSLVDPLSLCVSILYKSDGSTLLNALLTGTGNLNNEFFYPKERS